MKKKEEVEESKEENKEIKEEKKESGSGGFKKIQIVEED